MKSAQELGYHIDYIKLKDKLTDNRKLIRAYFFDAVPDPMPSPKASFLDALRHNGITVITKTLKTKEIRCDDCLLGTILKKEHKIALPNLTKDNQVIFVNQHYQKGVDVALVTELLRMAREEVYDTAIVVSGDNDYTNAVDCVKSMGMRVEIACFKSALGWDLRQIADKLTYLDNHIDDIKREIMKTKPKI